jgi:L-seryl-tRNA(Ser) seleniumtransferase
MGNELRLLPSVDRLLKEEKIRQLLEIFPHDLVVELVRENLANYRARIAHTKEPPSVNKIVENICSQAQSLVNPTLRPLINATGVVLHTNLGRAPLSQAAVAAMADISRGYNNLEFDIETGERGSRHIHTEALLCRLTGAEAALVVNNNAAAVLLALTVFAKKKEVIVSRGQAVEIGGGFRIPEVMRQSGAKLIEVGTTNCTYIRDYEQAITPQTAVLLHVHSSNFKVVGFAQMVTIPEMVALAKQRNLMVLNDLGSGCLLDTAQFGLAPEPTVQESIAAGVDLAFFSGDKLLGGPQAGIIVGKKIYLDKLKKHPLVRALRVDKTRIAGLAATLIHYVKGETPAEIPVWQMISRPLTELDRRAKSWALSIDGYSKVIDGESLIGGGSLPGATLRTRLVAIGDAKKPDVARKIALSLRRQEPPVIGRINDGVLLLDPRTVDPSEDHTVITLLRKAVELL